MIDLDQFDTTLIEHLRRDARQGNREIARLMGASESTVRQRLKKLEEAGVIRIQMIREGRRLGLTQTAYIKLAFEPRCQRAALDALLRIDEVEIVARVAGRYSILMVALCPTVDRVGEILQDNVETLPGFIESDVRIVTQTYKYRTDLFFPETDQQKIAAKKRADTTSADAAAAARVQSE